MASIIREVARRFGALGKGFSVTFRNMFRKTVTENYPFEPVHFQPRYRGSTCCTAMKADWKVCLAASCVRPACPANCIYIEAAENVDANRILRG